MGDWRSIGFPRMIYIYLFVSMPTINAKDHRKHMPPIYGSSLPTSISLTKYQGGRKTSSTNEMNPHRS